MLKVEKPTQVYARQLWYKFYNELEHTFDEQYSVHANEICKRLALICVNEILSELDEFLLDEKYGFERYFELVKEEITKL